MSNHKNRPITIFTFLFFSFAAFFVACEKDIRVPTNSGGNNNNSGGTPINSSLTAIIDGDSFIATSINAELNDTSLVIRGEKANGSKIVLSIATDTALTGVFVIDGVEKHSAQFIVGGQSPFMANGPLNGGQIRIMSIDTQNRVIGGSFFFKGTQSGSSNSKLVGDGKFTLQYQNKQTPTPNSNDTVYSTNPLRANNIFGALIKSATDTDTVNFTQTVSFMYLGNLHMEGQNGQHKISIIVDPEQGLGTISLDGNGSFNSAFYLSKTFGIQFPAKSGSLVISRNDTVQRRFTASFNFTGEQSGTNPPNTRDISNGNLDIYY